MYWFGLLGDSDAPEQLEADRDERSEHDHAQGPAEGGRRAPPHDEEEQAS